MSMRVAVTGASGFLGQHLARHFAREGTVVPLVRVVDERAPRGAVALEPVLADPKPLEGCDVLVHAAAVRHRHGTGTADYRASNVELVERLARAASRAGVKRFVHVSSVGVYGFPEQLPVTEAHPFAPRTLYSATKIHAEKLVRALAKELGFELVIVRPTIVYGPGDTNGMLDKMARMIRAGSYRIVGDGTNSLHHTYVDDIVQGIDLAARHADAPGGDFILAGPETITLGELSELVARAVGRPLPRLHIPLGFARMVAAGFDVLAYRGIVFDKKEPPVNDEKLDVMCVPIAFDPSKARRVLGYAPRVRYRDGVPRALASA